MPAGVYHKLSLGVPKVACRKCHLLLRAEAHQQERGADLQLSHVSPRGHQTEESWSARSFAHQSLLQILSI